MSVDADVVLCVWVTAAHSNYATVLLGVGWQCLRVAAVLLMCVRSATLVRRTACVSTTCSTSVEHELLTRTTGPRVGVNWTASQVRRGPVNGDMQPRVARTGYRRLYRC